MLPRLDLGRHFSSRERVLIVSEEIFSFVDNCIYKLVNGVWTYVNKILKAENDVLRTDGKHIFRLSGQGFSILDRFGAWQSVGPVPILACYERLLTQYDQGTQTWTAVPPLHKSLAEHFNMHCYTTFCGLMFFMHPDSHDFSFQDSNSNSTTDLSRPVDFVGNFVLCSNNRFIYLMCRLPQCFDRDLNTWIPLNRDKYVYLSETRFDDATVSE